MTPMSNDPAEARKRRKEIIQSQRSENELLLNSSMASNTEDNNTSVDEATNQEMNDSTSSGAKESDKKPPKKRKVASGDSSSCSPPSSLRKTNGTKNKTVKYTAGGKDLLHIDKKTQIRYDPEVPMNKDQLAAWRREARRVRNRESAAASRQRIRNRISDLEDEVGEWKEKYNHAVQRLDALETYIGETKTSSNKNENQQQQHDKSQMEAPPPKQERHKKESALPQQPEAPQEEPQQAESASERTDGSTITGDSVAL